VSPSTGRRGLATNQHELLEIKSMVPTWPNILTSGSSVRGVLAAALLTISALAGANAAEPRAETGFGSKERMMNTLLTHGISTRRPFHPAKAASEGQALVCPYAGR